MTHSDSCLQSVESHFPYSYFGELLILCIVKFFRDNLELLHDYNGSSLMMLKP